MSIYAECDFCGTHGGKGHHVYKEVEIGSSKKRTILQNFIVCDKCYEKHKNTLQESDEIEEVLKSLKQKLKEKLDNPFTKNKEDYVEIFVSLGLLREMRLLLGLLPFKEKEE